MAITNLIFIAIYGKKCGMCKPRIGADKVSKVWTKAIRLQDVKIKDQESVLTRYQKGFSLINKSLPYTSIYM